MLTKNDFSEIDKRMDKKLRLFENRITKKLNLIISLIENNYFNHEGRITRIEKHLNLN